MFCIFLSIQIGKFIFNVEKPLGVSTIFTFLLCTFIIHLMPYPLYKKYVIIVL